MCCWTSPGGRACDSQGALILWSSGCRQDNSLKPFWLQTRGEEWAIMEAFGFEETLRIMMLCSWASWKAVLNTTDPEWAISSFISFFTCIPSPCLVSAPTPCCTEQGFARCQSLHWNQLIVSSRAWVCSASHCRAQWHSGNHSPSVLVLSVSLEEEAVLSPRNIVVSPIL